MTESNFIRIRITKADHNKLTKYVRYDKKMYQVITEVIDYFEKSRKK